MREKARPVLSALHEAALGLAAHLARDVLSWAVGFVDYHGREKRSRSAVDFKDLLLLTARVLRQKPSVRRYFQRRKDGQ